MSEIIISAKNLSVSYDGVEALHGVDLDIYQDDFLGVIGPNGGGKTTLVKALLGILPYSGEITYSPTLFHKGKRLIGYMPQISEFDTRFPISVEEIILSGLLVEKGFFKRYNKEDYRRVNELLEMSGLTALRHSQIGDISGGQLQRALLCRAIIANPKLLILDEPTNFVDNKFENELYTMLSTLSSRMAIIMISHDIGTITSVVKSIVCVNHNVHRHESNQITQEQLDNYQCPIQIVSHGVIPHTVLKNHEGVIEHQHECGCEHHHH